MRIKLGYIVVGADHKPIVDFYVFTRRAAVSVALFKLNEHPLGAHMERMSVYSPKAMNAAWAVWPAVARRRKLKCWPVYAEPTRQVQYD